MMMCASATRANTIPNGGMIRYYSISGNKEDKNMSTETNIPDQIRINAIQYRANQHGFALAMRETPTDTADIRRVAHALDDIITYLD